MGSWLPEGGRTAGRRAEPPGSRGGGGSPAEAGGGSPPPGAPGDAGRPATGGGGSGERASAGAFAAGLAATIGAPHTTQNLALGWFGSPHWWQSRIIKQPAGCLELYGGLCRSITATPRARPGSIVSVRGSPPFHRARAEPSHAPRRRAVHEAQARPQIPSIKTTTPPKPPAINDATPGAPSPLNEPAFPFAPSGSYLCRRGTAGTWPGKPRRPSPRKLTPTKAGASPRAHELTGRNASGVGAPRAVARAARAEAGEVPCRLCCRDRGSASDPKKTQLSGRAGRGRAKPCHGGHASRTGAHGGRHRGRRARSCRDGGCGA
jgi:hypothetical protein